MRSLTWITGVLTTLALAVVWFAWELERNINADPNQVASDYITAAVSVVVIGGTLTAFLALASRRQGQPPTKHG